METQRKLDLKGATFEERSEILRDVVIKEIGEAKLFENRSSSCRMLACVRTNVAGTSSLVRLHKTRRVLNAAHRMPRLSPPLLASEV
ncbi:predicted protein [Lichtheimia corymbifera JMRC:FSU:9682]|uniref:Uncharacterized protein n=1 Tax=Lichtheimia corymbifera JMRC:FSU:9682 TaxID=1263082 RepID=A0A068RWU6_9FUNG|nr:predicted protein [Lichtheimia corymbifera JMRC:FSU:9682]